MTAVTRRPQGDAHTACSHIECTAKSARGQSAVAKQANSVYQIVQQLQFSLSSLLAARMTAASINMTHCSNNLVIRCLAESPSQHHQHRAYLCCVVRSPPRRGGFAPCAPRAASKQLLACHSPCTSASKCVQQIVSCSVQSRPREHAD